MSDKDINIHVKVQDVEQSKNKVDDFTSSIDAFYEDLKKHKQEVDAAAKSQEQLGDAFEKTQKQQDELGKKSEQSNERIDFQGKLFDSLKSKILGYVSASALIGTVIGVFDQVIAKLGRMNALARDFHETAVAANKTGQSLEFQTGTSGRQTDWGLKILEMQKAGGFGDSNIALQMMTSFDKQFKQQGGIANNQMYDLMKNIAPTFGSAGLSSQEIDAFLQIVEKTKTPLDAKAINTLFAKMKAGAAGGKMTINELLSEATTGEGFIGYLSLGGNIEKAISMYASAREVTSTKRAGQSLLDLVTQISTGQNEDAKRAIEQKLHVRLNKLTMDQRADAVLQYINMLPESTRVQTLQQKGFPSAMDLSKLGTPAAREIFETSEEAISTATDKDIKRTVEAYKDSAAFKEQAVEIDTDKLKVQSRTPAQLAWQNRLKLAKTMADLAINQNKDSKFVRDPLEGVDIAYKMMLKEAEGIEKKVRSTALEYRVHEFVRSLREARLSLRTPVINRLFGGRLEAEGYLYETELANIKAASNTSSEKTYRERELPENFSPAITDKIPYLAPAPWQQPFAPAQPQNGPVIINHSNNNSVNIYPSIGATEFNRMDFNE